MEYGAIDLHAKDSAIRIIDGQGDVVLEQRVSTTRERLTRVFGDRPAMRILLESGTGSYWVAEHLETLGHTVVIADPNYSPMYGTRTRRIKTDRRDVAALAEANRLGVYRAVHRVSAEQRARRRQLQVRSQLVSLRTQVISVVRAAMRSEGVRLRSGAAQTFGRRYDGSAVPVATREALAPLLELLAALAPLIARADDCTRATATGDPTARLLMTAPGVGPVVALAFQAALDDPHRFATAGDVAAYLGLVPREASSGERRRKGGITKMGPSRLRMLLVQSAWYLWRSPRGSATLHVWARRLSERRGRRIAVVAVARRLARILWAMWRDRRPFDPTHVGRLAAAA